MYTLSPRLRGACKLTLHMDDDQKHDPLDIDAELGDDPETDDAEAEGEEKENEEEVF